MGRRAQARSPTVVWEPQPGPQTALLACPIHEVFYGGARGGGKTDGMIGDAIDHIMTYGEGAKCLFVRRKFKNLKRVIQRAKQLCFLLGARWIAGDNTIEFPNGGTLEFTHLWNEDAAEDHQGYDYTWICFEEITQWPDPKAADKMRGTLRSSKGIPVFFRATGNPGGAGHNWVKARYISPAPNGYAVITDPTTGLQRVFIPSRLEDNPLLTEGDPDYEKRLHQTGPAYLVKAWRWGLWDIVAGGFFDHVWDPTKHVLPAFTPPADWQRCRSFDWGSAKPASLGLWAVSPGQMLTIGTRQIWMPKKSLVRTGELYTVQTDQMGIPKPNVGLNLRNSELGARIAKVSEGVRWRGCVADPSIWNESGGESIYEQLRKGSKAVGHNLVFKKADNERKAGWQKMLDMLEESRSDRAESPGIWVTENNVNWIRTVPVLQRDESDGDDVDTEGEDHAGDETRYMANTKAADISTINVRGA